MVRLLIPALVLLLAGCNTKKGSDVSIDTAGIFTPVSLSHADKEVSLTVDLGEYLIGSGPKTYKFTVRNNSLFPLTKLALTLENNESFGFGFEKSDEGKPKFPGKTGTCGVSLNPGQSCTVALQFETSITKNYEQGIIFSYLNYVEGASRPFTLTLLAGYAASLIFENEETNYYFGEPVGLAQLPVIEREIDQEYFKTLKMTNAGDLSARNLSDATIRLSQTCLSAISKDCPTGQNTAYRITHDCPTILKHDQSCEIKLYFRPKNQAATPSFKNIRYDSVVRIVYQSSMEGTEGVLNAYATTNSVNIEALFDTSIESLIYENKIVVGNRDMKTFRINNRGFKSGFLRTLITKDLLGIHVASCAADPGGSQWMVCYDAAEAGNILTLEQFPFKIKDKDNCLKNPRENGKLVPVDQGCQFEMWFQPSLKFLDDKIFLYNLHAHYDSLWKGTSLLSWNQLHTYDAESLAAARIVATKIQYKGITYTPDSTGIITPRVFDAGRIGLQSASLNKPSELLVTFVNLGTVPATLVEGIDGSGNPIPFKSDVPTGVALGPHVPQYFKNSFISSNNCKELIKNDQCVMQFKFAPISMSPATKNSENMFDDRTDADYRNWFKSFKLKYQDGSKYLDANFNGPTLDSGLQIVESRLKMQLVEKGQLDDYSEEILALGNQVVKSTYRKEIKLSNIGTKDIPYIYYKGNRNLFLNNSGLRVVATNSSKVTPSVPNMYDCRKIIDFGYQSGDGEIEIDLRAAESRLSLTPPQPTWDPLPIGSECILTIEYFTPKSALTNQDAAARLDKTKEPGRHKLLSVDGTEFAWEWAATNLTWRFIVDAFDGDRDDPAATGPLGTRFGKLQMGPDLDVDASFQPPAKLAIYSPRPLSGSMIYRGPINRADVFNDDNSALLIAALPYPSYSYFSDFNWEINSISSTEYKADFHKGTLSQNFVPATIPGVAAANSYEYVYYMGAVPPSTALKGRFQLANSGISAMQITATGLSTVLRPVASAVQHFSSNLSSITYPKSLNFVQVNGNSLSSSLDAEFTFTPGTDPGTYGAVLTVDYKDGTLDSPPAYYMLPISQPDTRARSIVTKRILVVAEVYDAPKLELRVYDYDVITDAINPATESLANIPTLVEMGWFDEASPSIFAFASIKIPSPTVKDAYVKRRFIFKNNSSQLMEDVKLLMREKSDSVAPFPLVTNPASPEFSYCTDNVTDPKCTGSCGNNFNLAAGAECFIEIRFQPTATTGAKAVTLTAIHKQGPNRYVHRNLSLSFNPQDPAKVYITNASSKSAIRLTEGQEAESNGLNYGSFVQTLNPQVLAFNNPINSGAGARKILAFQNDTSTKASFLKAYRYYYKAFINPAFNAELPSDLEPTDYSYVVDGVGYTLIYRKNYPASPNPRILVYANRACLTGLDTNAVPWFKRGFTGSDCQMIPILYADINYIDRNLNANVIADMDDNHVKLFFYDSERASSQYIVMHFLGFMRPNTSKVGLGNPSGASFFQEVTASSTANGTVSFKWYGMQPTTNLAELGDITGYRVYYSTTRSAVSGTFPISTTPHVDTAKNGTDRYVFNFPGTGQNKFMHFRIFPIRTQSSFTNHAAFGLNSNEYLSEPTPALPVLTVVIPSINYYYDHGGRFLIERNSTDDNWLSFTSAKSKCTTRPSFQIADASGYMYRSHNMINIPVWMVIKSNPAGTSNFNLNNKPMWLDNSLVEIHSTLMTDPVARLEYNATKDYDWLQNSDIFYLKRAGCGTSCSGFTAVGSALGQPGYLSYVDPTVNFAGARCFIQLP